jgi:hypothetical protein
MASIVQKAHASVTGGLTPSLTLTGVASGNDIIIVATGSNVDSTGLGCTVADGVNQYNSVVSQFEGTQGDGGQILAEIFRAKGVIGGTLNIVATFTDPTNHGANSSNAFTAYEVNGLDDTSANDGTTSNGGNPNQAATIDAGSITPTATGDLVFVAGIAFQSGSAQAPNAGGAFTLDFGNTTPALGMGYGSESQLLTNTGAVDCAFGSLPSNSLDAWAAVGAAFKAGIGGGESATPTVQINNALQEVHSGQIDRVALRVTVAGLVS